ncbi:MAG: C40 family peptidase [Gammaproteobacteria bacterium]|nr:C40 family peptidase [Gammaproteobacteria bacterium]
MIAQLTIRIPGLAAILMAAGMLSGCGGSPERPTAEDYRSAPATRRAVAADVGEHAVTIAMQQVGVPYRYGGHGPSGFDCSGLVQYSYLRAGKVLPRTTSQLWDSSTTVNRPHLQAGDLLFFSIEGKMQHVGMYIGNNRFVHAPSSGKYVQVASLSADYYQRALLRAGRPK